VSVSGCVVLGLWADGIPGKQKIFQVTWLLAGNDATVRRCGGCDDYYVGLRWDGSEETDDGGEEEEGERAVGRGGWRGLGG
jgi:hypothetical protein